MWRRLLWWSSDRPAVLPWAILLSLTLLISGQNFRLAVSESVVRFVYAPFLALRHRIHEGAKAFEKSERLTEELVALQIEKFPVIVTTVGREAVTLGHQRPHAQGRTAALDH